MADLNIGQILQHTILGNSFQDYLLVIVVFVLTYIILKIFKYVILKQLKRLSRQTKTKLDDLIINVVDDVGWPFYLLLSVYIAMRFIAIPAFLHDLLYYAVLIVVIFYAIKLIQHLIDYFLPKMAGKTTVRDEAALDLLKRLLKGAVWAIALILLLSNMGYDVSALIAGLGIGGIAIAFAMQNILSDIFASFSIHFDKPFKPGDFIVIGNDMGVVKKIGIKSTRLQTLQGEELVISNKELTSARVHNYKKMKDRRVSFEFGVTYDTPSEKLENIPDIVKDIFKSIKLADLERVHFHKFADSSLLFTVVYYVKSNDYTKYMDTQQEINFAIKRAFEKEGIEMAFPTQTVYLKRE